MFVVTVNFIARPSRFSCRVIHTPAPFISHTIPLLPPLPSPVPLISCHLCHYVMLSFCHTCLLSLALSCLPPLSIHRKSSKAIQPMSSIPTDSVWEFFSHTAYYNQRSQWVEEVETGDQRGEVPMKQPRLTRVSDMAGLAASCSAKEFQFLSEQRAYLLTVCLVIKWVVYSILQYTVGYSECVHGLSTCVVQR